MNGKELPMEVDTGARVSVVPQRIWADKFSHIQLNESSTRLIAFGGSELCVLGEANVTVKYKTQTVFSTLVVVKEGRNALLGRDLLSQIRLDWHELFHVHNVSSAMMIRNLKFSVNSQMYSRKS